MGLFRWLFSRACNQVFKQVDANNNGSLDALEIEIAVLKLYNVFNKKLPGWQDPPSRETIQASLKVFDADGNGHLEPKEFEEFARQMMNSGPDVFFARMGKQAMINTAILPAAGLAIQKSIPGLANFPLAMIAPVLGNLFGGVRGLIPG